MQFKLYSHLTPSLIKKQQSFALENFFEEEGQELFRVLQDQLEKFFSTPSGWMFALDKNKIVAQCLLFRRELSSPHLILGGFGEVCTHRAYRNQGIALELLKRSMDVLKKWDCDVAYLNSDPTKLKGFYSKLGFTALKSGIEFIGRSGVKYKDTTAAIAPINSIKAMDKLTKRSSPLFIGEGNW